MWQPATPIEQEIGIMAFIVVMAIMILPIVNVLNDAITKNNCLQDRLKDLD